MYGILRCPSYTPPQRLTLVTRGFGGSEPRFLEGMGQSGNRRISSLVGMIEDKISPVCDLCSATTIGAVFQSLQDP